VGGLIVERRSRKGRTFYGCANYPNCTYALWDKPIPEKCPQCGFPFMVEKVGKGRGHQAVPQKRMRVSRHRIKNPRGAVSNLTIIEKISSDNLP